MEGLCLDTSAQSLAGWHLCWPQTPKNCQHSACVTLAIIQGALIHRICSWERARITCKTWPEKDETQTARRPTVSMDMSIVVKTYALHQMVAECVGSVAMQIIDGGLSSRSPNTARAVQLNESLYASVRAGHSTRRIARKRYLRMRF